MKRIRLYNMILPIWMLWFFPVTWLYILPGNFLWDSLALLAAMALFRVSGKWKIYKSSILKIWGLGFASDAAGVLLMMLSDVFFPNYEVYFNPFSNAPAFLWATECVLISSVLIYLLNLKFSFEKTALDTLQKKRLSLVLAVLTAPYLFYLPTT